MTKPFLSLALAAVLAGACARPAPSPSLSDAGLIPQGRALAAARCAACHAVADEPASPRPDAPPFRELEGRGFPVADLIDALAQGALPSHPDMPAFSLPFEDAQALIAYVRSIQVRPSD